MKRVFEKGDDVWAISQGQEVDGVVVEKSTDREIWGVGSGDTFYLIRHDAWPEPRWIERYYVSLEKEDLPKPGYAKKIEDRLTKLEKGGDRDGL